MKKQPVNQIEEIKDLMERSSRFISLSGLSGVFAGIIALIGVAVAFFMLNYDLRYFNPQTYFHEPKLQLHYSDVIALIVLAFVVLVLAIFAAFIFTARKAKKQGLKIWNHSSKRLIINLMIPLISGGVFCLLLLWYGLIFLIAPSTLIFYGLALINAGKYTLTEIRGLGISELILGLLAAVFPGYGLIAWALGFGILHIIYGISMYFRYEYKKI